MMLPSEVSPASGTVPTPDFQLLFESVPGLYLVLAPELTIVAVSDAYLTATMTTREQMIGRGLFEVFPDNPDDPTADGTRNLRASLDRVRDRRVADAMPVQKYDIRRPDSEGGGFEERFWSPLNSPVFGADGEIQSIIHRVEDVTEFVGLKRRGAELDKETEELRRRAIRSEAEIFLRAREVAAVNGQLRAANEALVAAKTQAEEANRAKSEFLSRMSHELRTPLNAILGFGQLLEMEARDPRELDSVAQILHAGKHLLGLINEVLDIARVEAGKLSLSMEEVALPDVIGEVLDLVGPIAAGAGITIRAAGLAAAPHTVLADRLRLKQVLLNLVTNAVKYNREAGTVLVSVAEGENGTLRVKVADTGPGIAEENLDRMFSPFERVGAGQTDIEGTGLGLALSKGLVEAMGGTIGVVSSLGRGSTFWVDLATAELRRFRLDEAAGVPAVSLDVAPGDGRVPESGTGGRTGPRKVLYIEDNLGNLRLIEQLLQRRPDIELLTAMQGGMGIELAQQHAPDLVLLDLHLPDMHGTHVLARLRDHPATAATPVIILSADVTPGLVQRLRIAGADGHLPKPLDLRRLLEVLDGVYAPGEWVDAATREVETPGDPIR